MFYSKQAVNVLPGSQESSVIKTQLFEPIEMLEFKITLASRLKITVSVSQNQNIYKL